MITPEQIKARARRYWDNQRVLRAWVTGEALFPLIIPFKRPSAARLLEDYAQVRRWLEALKAESKTHKGYGYTVAFTEVAHRQLGSQSLPRQIRFDTPEDLFRYIGRQRDYARFQELVEVLCTAQPALRDWIARRPLKVLEHEAEWPRLLAVLEWFHAHPRPGRYLRQLDIPGVDSKFIEGHRALLKELLDRVLPNDAIDPSVGGLAAHGFERRYGLSFEEPLIRFRLLDPRLLNGVRITDLSVPVSEFARLALPCKRVYVTENKTNGLSFPPLAGTIVIFGLGYGITSLKAVRWLRHLPLHYWGDIDTHGFAMLSQLRGYFDHVESFLMDEGTLMSFKPLWGQEQESRRHTRPLAHLTPAETRLFERLRDDALGPRVRLEQERIAYGYVLERLRLRGERAGP